VKVFIEGNRLCGLVVTVPGYESRGPGSVPGATLVRIIEELFQGIETPV
jgi:hypothetical protein